MTKNDEIDREFKERDRKSKETSKRVQEIIDEFERTKITIEGIFEKYKKLNEEMLEEAKQLLKDSQNKD